MNEDVFNRQFFRSVPEELALQTQGLSEFIQADFEQQVRKEARESTERVLFRGKRRNPQGIPIPLTEAEAKAADEAIETTLRRISETELKVKRVQGMVDEQVGTAIGKSGDLAFKLDISKRQTLKKAVRVLFGYKTDFIDYSMYREMVKARAQLEQTEGTEYYEGKLQESN